MLQKCSCCGARIDSSAYACPSCGATRKARKDASESSLIAGIAVIAFICWVVGSSIGSMKEVFNGIKMTPNTWCGYYTKPETKSEENSSPQNGKIRILKDDIQKGGSSICLTSMSWKAEEYIELGEVGDTSYDAFDKEIIILNGKINDKKLYNVQNVRKW